MARGYGENITQAVKNIYLTGFMCAGKTLAGRALARRLGRPFADTDALLSKKYGAAPGELIQKRGLGVFRKLEAALVRELAAGRGRVIALGGGFYPSGKRAPLLKRSGVTVFLNCPWTELEARLKAARGPRPLLAGPWDKARSRARRLYAARLLYYRRADITVAAAGLTPAQAAEKIKKALK
jgi:shikimate kinase